MEAMTRKTNKIEENLVAQNIELSEYREVAKKVEEKLPAQRKEVKHIKESGEASRTEEGGRTHQRKWRRSFPHRGRRSNTPKKVEEKLPAQRKEVEHTKESGEASRTEEGGRTHQRKWRRSFLHRGRRSNTSKNVEETLPTQRKEVEHTKESGGEAFHTEEGGRTYQS